MTWETLWRPEVFVRLEKCLQDFGGGYGELPGTTLVLTSDFHKNIPVDQRPVDDSQLLPINCLSSGLRSSWWRELTVFQRLEFEFSNVTDVTRAVHLCSF